MGVRGVSYERDTNSILLVKHTYSEGWVLPGGGVEIGESTLAAIQRELREEAGIECDCAQVLDVYQNSSISKRDHVIIYLVNNCRKKQTHKRPKLEIAEARWFTLDKLPAELTPCTKYALELFTSTYIRKT